MEITFSNIIFLLGSFQALILIIGINIKKPLFSDLKKITTLLLVSIFFTTIYYLAMENKIYTAFPFLSILGLTSWMAITPLLYLLSCSVSLPTWELKPSALIYFLVPAYYLVDRICSMLGYPILDISNLAFLDLWMFLFFVPGIYFLGRALFLMKRQEKSIQNPVLIWYIYLLMGIMVVFSVIYISIRREYIVLYEYMLIWMLMVFVFILVYRIFRVVPFQHFFEQSKYNNQALEQVQIEKIARKLEVLMEEEKPYLNKKLSLSDLSQKIHVNSNDLSQLFNKHYRSNFYEYVNNYRIQYFEKLMLDPEFKQYKIMALAEESGFNSKATFYKAFKDKHQLTPTQFIKKYRN